MTSSDGAEAAALPEDTSDIVSRVRELDPSADDAAVRGYVHEIAAANALLVTVDVTGVPLEVAFSAAWPERFPT